MLLSLGVEAEILSISDTAIEVLVPAKPGSLTYEGEIRGFMSFQKKENNSFIYYKEPLCKANRINGPRGYFTQVSKLLFVQSIPL
jgi:hypothetical protein